MTITRTILGLAIATTMTAISIGDASATVARKQARHGHNYSTYTGGYYPRHYYRRQGGNPAIGAAVAGTALGVIGLAAGAAAVNQGYDPYDPYGYSAPAYAAPYGYGQPEEDLF